MYKRFFRMKDPKCRPEEIEWIEMSGKEFYRFIKSPENQERHFIDMGDVVLVGSQAELRTYRAEKDHNDYLREQEKGWITLSLYGLKRNDGYGGEEIISDDSQDIEETAIRRLELKALSIALSMLDKESSTLIHSLYLDDIHMTEREFARKIGVSQNAIHKQKKKVLKTLKFLVVKIQKSSQ